MKPICYDLFCGLGGWSEGFLAEGYECIGFDVEAHDYGTGGYPGKLILRDVRSIHGSELKDAAVIVASPPCQAYSYRAMPWKRAKALPPPDNTLFNECFRIQREASEAAGRYIPLIVENVRGAQPWVGKARWNYGSFYLWGDVPALMPITLARKMKALGAISHGHPSGNFHGCKGIPHRTAGHWTNPREHEGVKAGKVDLSKIGFTNSIARQINPDMKPDGFVNSAPKHHHSSYSRKAASAMIAKIPLPLSQHIARCFKPRKIETA